MVGGRRGKKQDVERTGWRLGRKGLPEGPIGIGGRGTSSCGGVGAVTCGGVEFFAGFCCVSLPPLPFFRSCCLMSTGAEAKALGAAFGWAATGASGLGWSGIGVSGAAGAGSV